MNMNNCLVTKLKASVANENLLGLGDFYIKPSGSTNEIIAYPITIKKVIGPGTVTIDGTPVQPGTMISSTKRIRFDDHDTMLLVNSKYECVCMRTVDSAIVDDYKYFSALKQLFVSDYYKELPLISNLTELGFEFYMNVSNVYNVLMNTKDTLEVFSTLGHDTTTHSENEYATKYCWDFDILKLCPVFRWGIYTTTQYTSRTITGTIESFVAKMRGYGRTTSTCRFTGCYVTFDSEQVYINDGFVEWTPTTITIGEKTINNSDVDNI